MKIRIGLLVILSLCVAPIARSAAADTLGNRVALVIGNAKYPDSEKPLKEPINDARDLADELKRDGFDVDLGENLTIDGMRRAFQRLYTRVKPGSVALVFFSGFGIQSGRQSYMIPVDAQLWTEPDVRRDGFSLETVLGEINSRGAAVKIALIDASRRNPYERRFRSFSAGLAPIIAPSGTLVMYSAALSSVVSDNGGDHSLFVSELLKEIRVPGLTAEETLNRTRVGVTRASRSEQVPWISSSLADEFSFVPGAQVPPGGKSAVVDRTPPREVPDDKQAATPAIESGTKTAATSPAESAKPEPPAPAAEAAKVEAPKVEPPTADAAKTAPNVETAKQAVKEPVKEPAKVATTESPKDLSEPAPAVTPPLETTKETVKEAPKDANKDARKDDSGSKQTDVA
ncbi:caspase family protein, partial [Rhodopseudomonas palustris]|uniref:caspase family protein n=3 Tax=Rhodopseudomonas TaxID=1073 RepID=UPI001F1C2319